MRAVRYAGLLGALSLLLAVDASAHRFGGPNDPCERKIGSSLIHIALYQPEFDPDAEYCEELPRDGNTVFVLDTLGDDLRRVPIGVEILSLDGAGNRRTVLSIPSTIHKRGVVDAQLTLSLERSYIAQVTVASSVGGGPKVYSFPIRVRPWYRALVVPTLMVLGVLALVAISIARFRMASAPSRTSRCVAIALLACCIVAADGCHREAPRATRTLPAVQLIDDHGNQVALGSLRGKVVLLDFIHIGCPGVCDELINKFGQIADNVRPELGSRVILVSITNDPDHDRPELLLKLAHDMQADVTGWLFLTGSAEDVDRVIRAFGVDNRRLADGSPNHITRVFMLGPDMHQRHEYPGMAMDSRAVASEIMNQIGRGGAS